MYYNDHPPPHFHIRYRQQKGISCYAFNLYV
ncbi:DUF4160 domain-containing protein [Argonema antarcticum A004/B2]|nr:DUF4160 domain-containing protein [Argonema antarcticum A004/B2]